MNKTDLAATWTYFLATRDEHARANLIEHYLHLARITARRTVPVLAPWEEWADFESVCMVRLCDAVDRYDPERGTKFETFAIALMAGAVREERRESDWLPRSVRGHRKQIARAQDELRDEIGAEPTGEEIAARLGWPEETYLARAPRAFDDRVGSLDAILASEEETFGRLADVAAADTSTPEATALEAAAGAALSRELDRLPARERDFLLRVFGDGETYRTIGQAVGTSESRVYQLVNDQALRRLRRRLVHTAADPFEGVAA